LANVKEVADSGEQELHSNADPQETEPSSSMREAPERKK